MVTKVQNEKVLKYGITHGLLQMDTHIGFTMLPVKNAIAIYDCFFRPLLVKEGLWVHVRLSVLDKTEFLPTDNFTRKPPSRMHLAGRKSEDQLPTEASVNTNGSKPDH